MPTVVGVKLRFAPKPLWFDPAGTEPVEGDSVIVETERGTEIGLVTKPPHEVADVGAAAHRSSRSCASPRAEDLARAEELERPGARRPCRSSASSSPSTSST